MCVTEEAGRHLQSSPRPAQCIDAVCLRNLLNSSDSSRFLISIYKKEL